MKPQRGRSVDEEEDRCDGSHQCVVRALTIKLLPERASELSFPPFSHFHFFLSLTRKPLNIFGLVVLLVGPFFVLLNASKKIAATREKEKEKEKDGRNKMLKNVLKL